MKSRTMLVKIEINYLVFDFNILSIMTIPVKRF